MACMEKPRCVWKMERGRIESGKIMTNDYREENLRNRIPVGLHESVERLGRFYVYKGGGNVHEYANLDVPGPRVGIWSSNSPFKLP